MMLDAARVSLEQPPATRRSTGMKPSTDTQIKLRIGYALSDRLVPIACAIIQNIVTSTRMIEELPAVAIEAMLDHVRENQRQDQPRTELDRAFKDLRACYIKYGEVALREARERERRLLDGITGSSSRQDRATR
jgi:hypothetical protein